MLDPKVLKRAAGFGAVLQVLMAVAGHFVPWVRDNLFFFGWMMFSGVAGLLYARDASRGYALGALGGAIAGGLGAVIGIGLSVLFGDTPNVALGLWTAISVLTGAIGGLWGQFGVFLKSKFG